MSEPDEIEVRFDLSEAREASFLENVLPLPKDGQGSWISAEDAWKAWGGK